ncbi:MAG: hypothetical protein ACP59X_02215 [Solidesulfovibrio sp. DCME]|uniref:hypothetical protein n=1 Tax=Solidesulfovibrio sp. DCME TaxID=3447380 RepID=UPI003D10271D
MLLHTRQGPFGRRGVRISVSSTRVRRQGPPTRSPDANGVQWTQPADFALVAVRIVLIFLESIGGESVTLMRHHSFIYDFFKYETSGCPQSCPQRGFVKTNLMHCFSPFIPLGNYVQLNG